jgi:hypothetical protein
LPWSRHLSFLRASAFKINNTMSWLIQRWLFLCGITFVFKGKLVFTKRNFLWFLMVKAYKIRQLMIVNSKYILRRPASNNACMYNKWNIRNSMPYTLNNLKATYMVVLYFCINTLDFTLHCQAFLIYHYYLYISTFISSNMTTEKKYFIMKLHASDWSSSSTRTWKHSSFNSFMLNIISIALWSKLKYL